MGRRGDDRVGYGRVDDRLVGWQDIMPTLLDLAGIPIPPTVEGISMIGDRRRTHFYGEVGEDRSATRMLHDGRHKLIYYPVGNRIQLFDLAEDPAELHDLAETEAHAAVREDLVARLMEAMYGSDEAWMANGELVGLPGEAHVPGPNRGLSGQRGVHWPPPPLDQSGRVVGAP